MRQEPREVPNGTCGSPEAEVPVIYRDTGRSSTEIPAVSSSEIRAGHLQRYGGVSSPEIRWFFISRDTVGNLSDSSAFSEDASQIGV